MQGFTLIELMIVVTIMGILVSISIPIYTAYLQRSQVSEAFSMIAGMQNFIAEYAQTYGAYPDNTLVKPVVGVYSVATADSAGNITVTMNATDVGADIQGKTIVFAAPALGASDFVWICTSLIQQQLLPKACTGS